MFILDQMKANQSKLTADFTLLPGAHTLLRPPPLLEAPLPRTPTFLGALLPEAWAVLGEYGIQGAMLPRAGAVLGAP